MYYLLVSFYIVYIFLFFVKVKSNFYWKIINFTIPIPIIFFDPIETYIIKGHYVDTVRIFNEINLFRENGWTGTDVYDNFILSKIYIFVFSYLDKDYNFLLPVINAFIIYFLVFLVLRKIAEYIDVNNNILKCSILYTTLMASYFNITTNIRYPLAISLLLICIFYDLIRQKHRIICFVMYFVILMLHPGTFIIFIVRLLVSLPKMISAFIFLMILFLGGDTIISLLSLLPMDVILGMIAKLDAYSDANAEQTITIYLLVTTLSINISIILLSILLNKYLKKDIYLKYRNFIRFEIFLSIGGILAIFSGIYGFLLRFEELSRYLVCIYIFLFSRYEFFCLSLRQYKILILTVKIIYIYMLIYFVYNILTYTKAFL